MSTYHSVLRLSQQMQLPGHISVFTLMFPSVQSELVCPTYSGIKVFLSWFGRVWREQHLLGEVMVLSKNVELHRLSNKHSLVIGVVSWR